MFVSEVAEAAGIACLPDYELLRRVLLELKRLHTRSQPGPAAPGDPELYGFAGPPWAGTCRASSTK
jgi:hypothetical protein